MWRPGRIELWGEYVSIRVLTVPNWNDTHHQVVFVSAEIQPRRFSRWIEKTPSRDSASTSKDTLVDILVGRPRVLSYASTHLELNPLCRFIPEIGQRRRRQESPEPPTFEDEQTGLHASAHFRNQHLPLPSANDPDGKVLDLVALSGARRTDPSHARDQLSSS